MYAEVQMTTVGSYRFGPLPSTPARIACSAAQRSFRSPRKSSTCSCTCRAPVGARAEGRAVHGPVARRRRDRQRPDASGLGAAPGARRRPGQADLHPDGRAARLPLHRAGRGCSSRAQPRASRRRAGGRRSRSRRSSRVLDFTNVSADREFGWLSSGIAETVTNDLRAAGTHRDHRSRAGRRSGPPGRHGPVGAPRRAHARSCGRRQLPARGRSTAHHRARRRCRTGVALAEAKADGALEQVFELQDRHRRAVRRDAWDRGGRRAAARRARETSSLEAYKAFTEGRVRLESLDSALVAGGDRRLRARGRARSALRAGPRRPRQRQVLAVRDVARAEPARRGAAGAGDRSRPARDRARAGSGRGTRDAGVPAGQRETASTKRSPRRGARSRSSPATGGNQFRLAHAQWGERSAAHAGARDGAVPGFPVRAFRSGDGPHRARRRSIAPSRCCAKAPSSRIGRRICGSATRRRGCTGCSASCGWPRATCVRRARSSSGRSVVGPSPALCRRVRDERARRRRLRGPATGRRRCRGGASFAAPSSSTRSTRGRSSVSERRTPLTATGGQPMPHSCTLRGRSKRCAPAGATARRQSRRGFSPRRVRATRGSGRRPDRLVDHPELPFTGWTVPIEPLFAPLRQVALDSTPFSPRSRPAHAEFSLLQALFTT